MLLRALQETRRLEVLSRPQIMALDNQPGRAFVGQIVPIILGSELQRHWAIRPTRPTSSRSAWSSSSRRASAPTTWW